MSAPYDVHFAPAAAHAYQKLETAVRNRIGSALQRLAADVSRAGRVRGKSVKTIRGSADTFHRLRVGDHRVMFDVIDEHNVILVLGIVHRRDLDRWLRSR